MGIIKPIVGTWFLLFWDFNPTGKCQDIRYDHWEPVVRNYTEAHWDAFMKDLASIGQKYLVLVCSFSGPNGRTCVYPSKVAEDVVKLGCEDALEAVFTAAAGVIFPSGTKTDGAHKEAEREYCKE